MNLSPSDMKNLLHHILSGKEFGVERSSESDCLKHLSCIYSQHKLKVNELSLLDPLCILKKTVSVLFQGHFLCRHLIFILLCV